MIAFLLIALVAGLEFELPHYGTKCVYYSFNKDDIAHGVFNLYSKPRWLQVNLVLNEMLAPGDTSKHKEISRKTDIGETGTFAFSAKEGEQEICFEIQMKEGVNYEYDPRQAQMFINLQVTEKTLPQKGQDAEGGKLSGADEIIYNVGQQAQLMKTLIARLQKSLEIRNVQIEDTDTGLGKLSFLFFFILLLFGGGQIWYLTHFLKKKKLV